MNNTLILLEDTQTRRLRLIREAVKRKTTTTQGRLAGQAKRSSFADSFLTQTMGNRNKSLIANTLLAEDKELERLREEQYGNAYTRKAWADEED